MIATGDCAPLIEPIKPLRLVRKAMRSPCGDQTGAALSAGPNVSREPPPRARSNNQMSGTPSFGSTSDAARRLSSPERRKSAKSCSPSGPTVLSVAPVRSNQVRRPVLSVALA